MDTRFLSRSIIIGFLIIISALFYNQIIRGDYFLNRARNNYIKIVPLPAMRGTFYDRNGEEIAVDKPVFNIAILPYQVRRELDELFSELSRFSGVSEPGIRAQYKRNFLNVFTPADILVDLSKEKALQVKEKFKDKVVMRALPQRSYPYPREFSHILGYVKKEQNLDPEYGYSPFERVGKNGLEMYYDTYLNGEDGADLLEVDSRGEIVGYLGTKERIKGKDMFLTIDARMQKAAYDSMGEWRGAFICLDPRSGEVLVLVSKPSYDANDLTTGINVSQVLNDQHKPLLNRAIQGRYPSGSVFKPVLAVAGLQEKLIVPSTTQTCTGGLSMGPVYFRCAHAHGEQDLLGAIAHSCNVYFYKLGLKLDVDRLAKWARIFQMDQLSLIDLPFEKKGFVPDRHWKKKQFHADWFPGDTLNFSIGQGYFEITPLRAALVMAVFANRGSLVYPYLAESIERDPLPHLGPTRLNIEPDNLSVVSRGLREVVSRDDGTAHVLNNLGLEVAGKTGTAQTSGKHHGWFAGFFPSSAPRYAICVFLENAGSSYEAVKVFHSFLARAKEDGLL